MTVGVEEQLSVTVGEPVWEGGGQTDGGVRQEAPQLLNWQPWKAWFKFWHKELRELTVQPLAEMLQPARAWLARARIWETVHPLQGEVELLYTRLPHGPPKPIWLPAEPKSTFNCKARTWAQNWPAPVEVGLLALQVSGPIFPALLRQD